MIWNCIRTTVFLSSFFLLFQACQPSNSKQFKVSFTALNTKCSESLRGLHVLSQELIWASGTNGTVLRSTDAGATWKICRIPNASANDFRSLHAWDDKRALVFGISGPSFAYLTKNGGESWTEVYSDSTKGLFFNSLKFADEKNGLAISDPINGKFFVLRTTDGGENWERVMDIPDVEEGEANFAASNTCIEYLPSGKAWIASGGKAARVFYSTDFGLSWQVTSTPIIRGMASSGIFSVSFVDDNTGVLVGGVYDQPEINTNIAAYTFDGGKSWHPAETMPKEYRSCAQPVNKQFYFAVGKTGCDISYDKGANWSFIDEEGFYTFRAVDGELKGYAAGAGGKVARIDFQ